MSRLTIVATLFMPLTFVTGLFGMNVTVPFQHQDNFDSEWPAAGALVTLSADVNAFIVISALSGAGEFGH
jgi:Mg2+ and Co2+ transporter CorA